MANGDGAPTWEWARRNWAILIFCLGVLVSGVRLTAAVAENTEKVQEAETTKKAVAQLEVRIEERFKAQAKQIAKVDENVQKIVDLLVARGLDGH